jgi:hypothetical protein
VNQWSKVHLAVDTLSQLLTVMVIPANKQDRAQGSEMAKQIQGATGVSVEVAFVDQGYTVDQPAAAAEGATHVAQASPESASGARVGPVAGLPTSIPQEAHVAESDVATERDPCSAHQP